MANEKRLRNVVAFIEKRAANVNGKNGKLYFDMGEWWEEYTEEIKKSLEEFGWAVEKPCGTYMCFAGWTAKYANKKVIPNEACVITGDGSADDRDNWVEIRTWARDYLGLTYTEALELFEEVDAHYTSGDGKQNISTLKARIKAVTGVSID